MIDYRDLSGDIKVGARLKIVWIRILNCSLRRIGVFFPRNE